MKDNSQKNNKKNEFLYNNKMRNYKIFKNQKNQIKDKFQF